MRILFTSTAAIALSGCSMLGFGSGGYSQGPSYGHAPAPVQSKCNPYAGLNGNADCTRSSIWNVEGAIGQEFMVGGDFTTPDDVTAIPGLTPNAVSMKDAYNAATRYELGASYAANPNRKITATASYSKASGNDVAFGTLAGPPANTLRGTASDYEAFGLEAGVRQYFRPRSAPLLNSLRPYVEGRLGAAKIDDISIQNLRDNNGVINGGTANMYQGGWIPTASGLVGVEAPVFQRATLALETGLRYRGALKADTTDFGPGGGVGILSGINNGSSNLTVPVMLRGRYRF